MHARAKLGLARTFQITSVLPGFSALENVALAVQSHSGSSFRLFGDAAGEAGSTSRRMEALSTVGLAERAHSVRRTLSHGEKRASSLAIALALNAEAPCSSMSRWPVRARGNGEQLVATCCAGLKARLTILLVEHDMQAVFALADRISVLVNGRLIATGDPDRVRADAQVRAAYLGETM